MTLIADLARESGVSQRDVQRIVNTAPRRYKVFPISKRDGGERLIAQPALELKALQRILTSRVFAELPVHDSAYAYVRGPSIRQNALRHVRSVQILKLDFKNFFHSIRPVDLERVLLSRPSATVSRSDFETIYQLAFWGKGLPLPVCLSIGAPSSPIISNVVMYELDKQIAELAARYDATYTRYADDLTISTSSGASRLISLEKKLEQIVDRSLLNLTLNEKKRGLYNRGERRMVTGLIITPDHKVSIGRERKRLLRATVHKVLSGEGDDRLLMKCKGMLAFVISAEPSLLKTLMRSYGADEIRGILRAPKISFYEDPSSIWLT